jgi:hypothetical protein
MQSTYPEKLNTEQLNWSSRWHGLNSNMLSILDSLGYVLLSGLARLGLVHPAVRFLPVIGQSYVKRSTRKSMALETELLANNFGSMLGVPRVESRS